MPSQGGGCNHGQPTHAAITPSPSPHRGWAIGTRHDTTDRAPHAIHVMCPTGAYRLLMGQLSALPTAAPCSLHDGPLDSPKRTEIRIRAHRPTHLWQNFETNSTLENAYTSLSNSPRTVDEILAKNGLEEWSTPDTTVRDMPIRTHTTLPRFGTRSATRPSTNHGGSPPTGLLFKDGTLTSPSPEVRETLMVFTTGDTAAPGLTIDHRNHMLGQYTDLNILSWALAIISSTPRGYTTPQSREARSLGALNIHFLAANPRPQGDSTNPQPESYNPPGAAHW